MPAFGLHPAGISFPERRGIPSPELYNYILFKVYLCYTFAMTDVLIQSQMQSQTFFFISSIGFIILWALAAIFLFYLIRAMSTFSNIMDKMERDINNIGEATEDLLDEVRDSALFQFFFRKKKRYHKEK
jgi:predicted membrane protein